jgi:hypothetical protein
MSDTVKIEKIDMEVKEDIKDLNRKFDDFSKGHNEFMLEIRSYMARQTEACLNHKGISNKLETAIEGNGKPGLKADVAELQTGFKLIKWVVVTISVALLPLVGSALWHWLATNAPK